MLSAADVTLTALWPMTPNYIEADGAGGKRAIDISGSGNVIDIGFGVSLTTGPYDNPNGAFKFT